MVNSLMPGQASLIGKGLVTQPTPKGSQVIMHIDMAHKLMTLAKSLGTYWTLKMLGTLTESLALLPCTNRQ